MKSGQATRSFEPQEYSHYPKIIRKVFFIVYLFLTFQSRLYVSIEFAWLENYFNIKNQRAKERLCVELAFVILLVRGSKNVCRILLSQSMNRISLVMVVAAIFRAVRKCTVHVSNSGS